MALEIKSSAISNNSPIPIKYSYSCGIGSLNLSPPLSWSGVPKNTKSFALISDDPDAPVGNWVHWVVWNISATVTGLKEGIEKTETLPDGTKQGITDYKEVGYGGPCPPSGTHRYFFKLYALDTTLNLSAKTTKADLEAAMKGHILEQAILMGTFSHQK